MVNVLIDRCKNCKRMTNRVGVQNYDNTRLSPLPHLKLLFRNRPT